MRQALTIFRKDVRHLWPFGAAVSAIIVLQGWIDIQSEYAYLKTLNTRIYEFEPLLLLVTAWCVVGILMQQESAVGDRQYWLTRPLSRTSLLGAKALFLAIFISVPGFVCQAVVLSITGFPHHFAALVWNQALIICGFAWQEILAAKALFLVTMISLPQWIWDRSGQPFSEPFYFNTFFLLPAVAFAVVTSNLGESILAFVCSLLALAILSPDFDQNDPRVVALFISALTLAIILLQYSRRREVLARSIVVAAIAALVILTRF